MIVVIVAAPAGRGSDSVTFRVTSTIEGKMEIVPLTLQALAPGQKEFLVAAEKEITCPSLVPVTMTVNPGPAAVEVIPGMGNVVPSPRVHVNVGVVSVTVSAPYVKVPAKRPEFSRGGLATNCADAFETPWVMPGAGVQSLGEVTGIKYVICSVPE